MDEKKSQNPNPVVKGAVVPHVNISLVIGEVVKTRKKGEVEKKNQREWSVCGVHLWELDEEAVGNGSTSKEK